MCDLSEILCSRPSLYNGLTEEWIGEAATATTRGKVGVGRSEEMVGIGELGTLCARWPILRLVARRSVKFRAICSGVATGGQIAEPCYGEKRLCVILRRFLPTLYHERSKCNEAKLQ
jgi:hypothetical protein